MGSEAIAPIIDRVRALAGLQEDFAQKRKRRNEAVPDPVTGTAQEREAFRLLNQIDHAAERAVQHEALRLAADAPALVAALAYHDPNCNRPCCD